MSYLSKSIAIIALAATSVAFAQTKTFRDIIGDAANIQMDAEALADKLKTKVVDEAALKAEVSALAKHVDQLRADVERMDAEMVNLSPSQKKDWELAKTKAQLVQIFTDTKSTQLEAADVNKNRSLLRAHANGIASRAAMLQRTLNRLER